MFVTLAILFFVGWFIVLQIFNYNKCLDGDDKYPFQFLNELKRLGRIISNSSYLMFHNSFKIYFMYIVLLHSL